LAELVAYLELAHAEGVNGALSEGWKAVVDESVQEPIRWVACDGQGEPVERQARLPRVIFSR
jgi:hypothetical protein